MSQNQGVSLTRKLFPVSLRFGDVVAQRPKSHWFLKRLSFNTDVDVDVEEIRA